MIDLLATIRHLVPMKYIGFDRALPIPQLLNKGVAYDAVYLTDAPNVPLEGLSLIVGIVPSYPEVDHDITVVLAHDNQNWVFTPEAGYSELEIHNYQGGLGGTWVISVEDKSVSPGLWSEWGLKATVIVPEPSIFSLLLVGLVVGYAQKLMKK